MTRDSPPSDRDTTAKGAPSVTVVVATKNAGRTIEACLRSIRSQSFPCRLVVVDNSSSDTTPEIARRLADAVITQGPERSAQRNCGARSFPADIVGFIDADMVLEPTVVEEAVAAISAGAAGAVVPERTVGSGFWVEVRAYERSFYAGCDSVEAARFFRWDVFERTGGFDENLTGPEDWDLSEAAAKLGPLARTTACILHDEGTLSYLDACRKKAYYAEGLRRYVAKRGLAAARHATDRPWLRQPRALLNRHGGGMLALKAGESVAVVATLVSGSASRLSKRADDHTPGIAGVHAPVDLALSQAKASRSRGAWLRQGAYRCAMGVKWSVRICRAMRHGPRTIGHLGLALLMPRCTGDITFCTRDGIAVVAPIAHRQGYEWWPVIEVLVEDCYRLADLTSHLPLQAQVLDIGAHIGTFSTLVGRLIPRAHIFSFEPSPTRAAYLRRNLEMNELASRVTVSQVAVGGTAGPRQLTGSVVVNGAITDEGETVEMVTLDAIMSEIQGPVDLVKIDCEGSEYEIFASASDDSVARIQRLLLEYHQASRGEVADLFSRLERAGLVEQWREDSIPGQLGVVYFDRSRS